MIGYWFKPSILLLFIPFISLCDTNNTNKYTLNIVGTNVSIRTLYIEKQRVDFKNKELPLDITALVNINTNQPNFSLVLGCDEMDMGNLIVNIEIYKNNNLIAGFGYENRISLLKDTNGIRSKCIFLIDK